MSDHAGAVPPVPAGQPVPGHGTIHDAVIADIRQREREGNAEYGHPHWLHNGLDGLQEAYKEALDMTFWLRQEIEERKLWEAAAPLIAAQAAADERERIRQLALSEAAKMRAANFSNLDDTWAGVLEDFAELLDGTS